MISRMNSSKVIGLVALAEKPGLGEALRIMRRELSRHGLGSCVIETPDALERAIGRCGMLVTFGGDGTMLTVSSLAAAHHVRGHQFVIINGPRPQAGHVIEVIVSMVTHGYIQPR